MQRILTIVVLLTAGLSLAWVKDTVNGEPWQVPAPTGVAFCLAVNSNEATTPQLQDQFRTAVQSALASWAAPCSGWCAHMDICPGPPPPFGDDGANWVYWLDSAYPLGTTSLAVTLVSRDTNTNARTDTDVIFNDRDFFWIVGADPQNPDVQSVAVHELGHALGLGHYLDPNGDCTTACNNAFYPPAVLCATYCPGQLIRYPTPDDLDGLCALYPSATVTACPSADGNPDAGDPEPNCACSSAGAGMLLAALLALLALRARRSRATHP